MLAEWVLAYLGGRLVLGSGRTWPHDFLFLVGFLSVVEPGVEGVSSGFVARPGRAGGDNSPLLSSVKDWGVMISSGFIVVAVDEAKRDGYMSPGVERKDSVGEFSNLMSGEGVWQSQDSIMVAGGLGRFCVCVIDQVVTLLAKEQDCVQRTEVWLTV